MIERFAATHSAVNQNFNERNQEAILIQFKLYKQQQKLACPEGISPRILFASSIFLSRARLRARDRLRPREEKQQPQPVTYITLTNFLFLLSIAAGGIVGILNRLPAAPSNSENHDYFLKGPHTKGFTVISQQKFQEFPCAFFGKPGGVYSYYNNINTKEPVEEKRLANTTVSQLVACWQYKLDKFLKEYSFNEEKAQPTIRNFIEAAFEIFSKLSIKERALYKPNSFRFLQTPSDWKAESRKPGLLKEEDFYNLEVYFPLNPQWPVYTLEEWTTQLNKAIGLMRFKREEMNKQEKSLVSFSRHTAGRN